MLEVRSTSKGGTLKKLLRTIEKHPYWVFLLYFLNKLKYLLIPKNTSELSFTIIVTITPIFC